MNETEISTTLNLGEINVVLAGLAELPAKVSYDIINKIKAQAEGQLKAQATNMNEVPSAAEGSTEELLVE